MPLDSAGDLDHFAAAGLVQNDDGTWSRPAPPPAAPAADVASTGPATAVNPQGRLDIVPDSNAGIPQYATEGPMKGLLIGYDKPEGWQPPEQKGAPAQGPSPVVLAPGGKPPPEAPPGAPPPPALSVAGVPPAPAGAEPQPSPTLTGAAPAGPETPAVAPEPAKPSPLDAVPPPAKPGGAGMFPSAAAEEFDPFAAAGMVKGQDGRYAQPTEDGGTTAPTPPPAPPGSTTANGVPRQELRDQPWYQSIYSALQGVHQAFHGASDAAGHNFVFGLDDILGPLLPALSDTLINGTPFGEAYSKEQAALQHERHASEAAAPVASLVGGIVGGVAGGKGLGSLYRQAPVMAGKVGKTLMQAQNLGTSLALGGAQGGLMTEGSLQDRIEGAKTGVMLGGALHAATPLVTSAARFGRGVIRGTVPGRPAFGERTVGNILNESAPGGTYRPAPTPGVPLNIAQAASEATRGQLADLVRLRGEENLPAAKALRDAQNAALLRALPRSNPAGAEPAQVAAESSERGVAAIRRAKQVITTEAKRLWARPSLNKPTISTRDAKSNAQNLVGKLRSEETDLASTLEESKRLRTVLARLYRMPAKASARDINDVVGRFRQIARDYQETGDVRHLATRFANEVNGGLASAPEVAGRAPLSLSDLEAPPAGPTRAQQAAALQRQTEGAAPKRPESLNDYVVSQGGIRSSGETRAMELHKMTARARASDGTFIRGKVVDDANGLTHHEMRQRAAQEGFLPMSSTEDEFLQLLNREAHGHPVYRDTDEAIARDWEAHRADMAMRAHRAEEARDKLLAVEQEAGANLSDEELDHAVQMMVGDPSMHPQEALEQAVRSGEMSELDKHAQRLAFGAPGVDTAAATEPFHDLQSLREGVKADPQVQKDLAEARAFTRREHEVLDHASFSAILNRNGSGNLTATEGTALNKFFDFANGVEKPGAPRNLDKFLDDIKGSWLKLSAAERGKSFDPDHVQQVMDDLVKNARDFMIAKFLGAVSTANTDAQGNALIGMGRASEWLRKNLPLMRRTGMFTDDQIAGLLDWARTARMINRGNELGTPAGSPTFKLLSSKDKWMDVFMSPVVRGVAAAGVDAAVAGSIGALVGEGGLGIVLGVADQGKASQWVLQRIYAQPRERLLEKLDEAIRNPQIAADLQRRAGTGTAQLSPATRAWIRSLLVSGGTQETAEHSGSAGALPSSGSPPR